MRDLGIYLHTDGNCSSRNDQDGKGGEKNNGLVQDSRGVIAHRGQPEERVTKERETWLEG